MPVGVPLRMRRKMVRAGCKQHAGRRQAGMVNVDTTLVCIARAWFVLIVIAAPGKHWSCHT